MWATLIVKILEAMASRRFGNITNRRARAILTIVPFTQPSEPLPDGAEGNQGSAIGTQLGLRRVLTPWLSSAWMTTGE